MSAASREDLRAMLLRLVEWSSNPEPDGEVGRAMWAQARALVAPSTLEWPELAETLLAAAQQVVNDGEHKADGLVAVDAETFKVLKRAVKAVHDEAVAIVRGLGTAAVPAARPAGEAGKWLAIQPNSEGRPCGWGSSVDKHAAELEATRQWMSHGHPEGSGCYPGEKRGRMTVRLVGVGDGE